MVTINKEENYIQKKIINNALEKFKEIQETSVRTHERLKKKKRAFSQNNKI